MDNLISSLRRMGRLLILAVLVIITVGIGIYYMQQQANESRLQEDISRLSLTLAKPLPSAEKLQQQYREIAGFFTPVTMKEALDTIIGLAKASGIDVESEGKTFYIPPQDLVGKEKVGDGTYEVLSINNIAVQGKPENVMAFISSLEAQNKLHTLVIKRIVTSQVSEAKTVIEDTEMAATVDVRIYSRAGSVSK